MGKGLGTCVVPTTTPSAHGKGFYGGGMGDEFILLVFM